MQSGDRYGSSLAPPLNKAGAGLGSAAICAQGPSFLASHLERSYLADSLEHFVLIITGPFVFVRNTLCWFAESFLVSVAIQ